MKKIDEKIENYLTEKADDIILRDYAQEIDYKVSNLPSCWNCFYSLPAKKLTCENPTIYAIIAHEEDWPEGNYSGQFDMIVSPAGKCKFYKKGRE
jgi:hypothetical protein